LNEKAFRKLQDWTRKVTRGQRDSAVFLNLWHDTMATDPTATLRAMKAAGLEVPH